MYVATHTTNPPTNTMTECICTAFIYLEILTPKVYQEVAYLEDTKVVRVELSCIEWVFLLK